MQSFVCKDCSKVFKKRSSFIQHERVHTGDRPFVCDHEGCGKSFAQAGNLVQHKISHNFRHLRWMRGECEKPHKCAHPNCTKSFISRSSLATHVRNAHKDDAPAPTNSSGNIKPSTGKNNEFTSSSTTTTTTNGYYPFKDANNYVLTNGMLQGQYPFMPSLPSGSAPPSSENPDAAGFGALIAAAEIAQKAKNARLLPCNTVSPPVSSTTNKEVKIETKEKAAFLSSADQLLPGSGCILSPSTAVAIPLPVFNEKEGQSSSLSNSQVNNGSKEEFSAQLKRPTEFSPMLPSYMMNIANSYPNPQPMYQMAQLQSYFNAPPHRSNREAMKEGGSVASSSNHAPTYEGGRKQADMHTTNGGNVEREHEQRHGVASKGDQHRTDNDTRQFMQSQYMREETPKQAQPSQFHYMGMGDYKSYGSMFNSSYNQASIKASNKASTSIHQASASQGDRTNVPPPSKEGSKGVNPFMANVKQMGVERIMNPSQVPQASQENNAQKYYMYTFPTHGKEGMMQSIGDSNGQQQQQQHYHQRQKYYQQHQQQPAPSHMRNNSYFSNGHQGMNQYFYQEQQPYDQQYHPYSNGQPMRRRENTESLPPPPPPPPLPTHGLNRYNQNDGGNGVGFDSSTPVDMLHRWRQHHHQQEEVIRLQLQLRELEQIKEEHQRKLEELQYQASLNRNPPPPPLQPLQSAQQEEKVGSKAASSTNETGVLMDNMSDTTIEVLSSIVGKLTPDSENENADTASSQTPSPVTMGIQQEGSAIQAREVSAEVSVSNENTLDIKEQSPIQPLISPSGINEKESTSVESLQEEKSESNDERASKKARIEVTQDDTSSM